MITNKNQRVAVFVDVQNMYYSAKQLYNSKVNFSKILDDAVAGRRLIRAMAYAISADVGKEEKFQDALANIGYEVRLKDLQIFHGGAKKGDWDVGIAMDIVRITPKVDAIVLVSGDGDFQDLMEWVRAQGCRAEVMAFHKTSSNRIRDSADTFHNLEDDKYLIKYKKYNNQNNKNNSKNNNNEANKIKEELQNKNKEVKVSNEKVNQEPPKIKGSVKNKEESKEKTTKKVTKKATKKTVKKSTKKVTKKTPENKENKPKLLDKLKKAVTKK